MSGTNVKFLDEKLEKEKAYWEEKLSNPPASCGIPLDFRRANVFTGEKSEIDFSIDPDLQVKLLAVCEGSELLVFTVALTAVKICLYKYTRDDDVIVGTTIHERYGKIASINKVLALRDRINGEITSRQFLLNVKQTINEAFIHQKYPFERILDLLKIDVPVNRAPLFDVVVLLEN